MWPMMFQFIPTAAMLPASCRALMLSTSLHSNATSYQAAVLDSCAIIDISSLSMSAAYYTSPGKEHVLEPSAQWRRRWHRDFYGCGCALQKSQRLWQNQANIATFVLDLVHAAVQTNGLAKVFHAEEGLAVQWLWSYHVRPSGYLASTMLLCNQSIAASSLNPSAELMQKVLLHYIMAHA